MKLDGFKVVDKEKLESTYGGWAWLVHVPAIISSILSAVTSFKLLSSPTGSIKTKGDDIEAKWDGANNNGGSQSSQPKAIYYVY